MVCGAGPPGVSVPAPVIGSIAAEGSGLSRMLPETLCELSAYPGWHPAPVGSGCCKRARVCSRRAVAGLRVQEDEMVEGVVDWRWGFVDDRGAPVCF